MYVRIMLTEIVVQHSTTITYFRYHVHPHLSTLNRPPRRHHHLQEVARRLRDIARHRKPPYDAPRSRRCSPHLSHLLIPRWNRLQCHRKFRPSHHLLLEKIMGSQLALALEQMVARRRKKWIPLAIVMKNLHLVDFQLKVRMT